MINRSKLASTYTAIIASLMLAGCSSTTLQSPKMDNLSAFTSSENASQQLKETQPCCDNVEQLKYQLISAEKTHYIPFDQSSEAYSFESGKSFYKGYKLDENISELDVTISGLFYNTVFVPQVLLLDSQFNQTRIISADTFIYKEAKFLDGDELNANFSIKRPNLNNPTNETYFIIYSTHKAMQQETTITHPAKLDARGRSVAEPDIADPIIKHSAMGVVKLELDILNKGEGYIAQEPQESEKNNTEQNLTEAQYNEKIVTAIADGAIETALQLVEEAEAAGSKTARTTFVEAIKK